MEVRCPYCDHIFRVKLDEMLYASVRCEKCKRIFYVNSDGITAKDKQVIDPS